MDWQCTLSLVKSPKSPARRLTHLYIVALAMIALLAILGQIIEQVTLDQNESDARIVNQAGRQRMLGERLLKEVFASSQSGHAHQSIDKTIASLRTYHQGLRERDPALDLEGENSATIKGLFEEMQPSFDRLLKLVALVRNPTADTSAESLMAELTKVQTAYIEGMDAIVLAYEVELRDRLETAERIKQIILGLTLLLLLAQGILIFRPATRTIQQALDRLEDHKTELESEVVARTSLLEDEIDKRRESMVELEQVNLRLSESEMQNRAVVNNASDAIIRIDQSGEITAFNPAAERMFGHSAKHIVGKNVTMLMPAAQRAPHVGGLAKYVAGGPPKVIGVGVEVEGLKSDGSLIPIELGISEMRIGEKLEFVGIARDISERRRNERMKNDFISTVSHELRTPLTSIQGALGLVVGGVVGNVPPTVKEMADIALENCKRLVRLVNDILDIEKLEAGEAGIRNEVLNLHDVVTQSIKQNSGLAVRAGVSITLTDPGDINATVFADADRLTQVLTNLLSNAVKFSPKDGIVTVALRVNGDKVRVEVQDQGPGIGKEFQSQVFEAFTQEDQSDTRQRGGTGLGLNISKKIIERLGGTLGFQTQVGVGTLFYFELDQHAPVDAKKAADIAQAP
jgi:PAS domain S-box-containing protein